MTHQRKLGVLCVSLAIALGAGIAFGRGFGGGFRGGGFGGFRGGSFGGFHGDYGGFHGGYGGMSSFNRSPSFSSSGSFDRERGYGGGGYGLGARSGSFDTARGGSFNYGRGRLRRPGPGVRGGGAPAYGVEGTTAGGRSFADVGRAGGVAGPGGAAVAGRANVGGVEGPRGAAAFGSRSGVAVGRGGAAVAGRGFAGRGYHGSGFNNAYGAYHQGWVHGYWNGHDNAWGWRGYGGYGGWGYGAGLGWGLAAWGMGSMLYGMGYMPYDNPYYVAPAVGVADYDYSQPIDTTAAAPAASITDPAIASFDAARTAFKAGDYQDVLRQTGTALASLPDDRDIQEFRALCLFALGRYDEAAAPLYSVLSVGPGWDWTTLSGLYPDVDVYTTQLRALEAFCNANPKSSAARFVLTYEYLTEGFTDAAVGILKQVVALNPKDALSAKLLRQLDPSADKAAPASGPTPTPTPVPADTTPPQGASIAGTWTAHPETDTAIRLSVQAGGPFTWEVTRKGKAQQFSGTSTFGDGLLTLAQDKGPAVVGRVSWKDATHMTFPRSRRRPRRPGAGLLQVIRGFSPLDLSVPLPSSNEGHGAKNAPELHDWPRRPARRAATEVSAAGRSKRPSRPCGDGAVHSRLRPPPITPSGRQRRSMVFPGAIRLRARDGPVAPGAPRRGAGGPGEGIGALPIERAATRRARSRACVLGRRPDLRSPAAPARPRP